MYLLRLDDAAGLYVDDAWYIVLAKAWRRATDIRLISSATTPILPAFPPGFPLLLAPLFLAGPISRQRGAGSRLSRSPRCSASAPPDLLYLTRYRDAAGPGGRCRGPDVLDAGVRVPGDVDGHGRVVFTLAQVLGGHAVERSRGATDATRWRGRGCSSRCRDAASRGRVRMIAAAIVYCRPAAAAGGGGVIRRRRARVSSRRGSLCAPRTPQRRGARRARRHDAYSLLRAAEDAPARTNRERAGSASELPRADSTSVAIFGRDLGAVMCPAVYRGTVRERTRSAVTSARAPLRQHGHGAGTMVVSLVLRGSPWRWC